MTEIYEGKFYKITQKCFIIDVTDVVGVRTEKVVIRKCIGCMVLTVWSQARYPMPVRDHLEQYSLISEAVKSGDQ